MLSGCHLEMHCKVHDGACGSVERNFPSLLSEYGREHCLTCEKSLHMCLLSDFGNECIVTISIAVKWVFSAGF